MRAGNADNAHRLGGAACPSLRVLNEPTEGQQPGIVKHIGRVIRILAYRGLKPGPS